MLQLASSLDAFAVEEIPLFKPCGQGAFQWLWIEKENLHTDTVIRILAQHYGLQQRHIHVAGRKDKLAVTRQYFSLPYDSSIAVPDGGQCDGGSWHVIASACHDHSLKLGQLIGNRFTLRLEKADNEVVVKHVADAQKKPLLNLFGEQRFGHNRQNVLAMRALSQGQFKEAVDILCQGAGGDQGLMRTFIRQAQSGKDPERLFMKADKRLRQFLASVAQSYIFNCVAQARVDAGLLHKVREGDLLLRKGKSAFHARADELEQIQVDINTGEVACTAPLPGFKVRQPGEMMDAQERTWAVEAQIDWALFDKGSLLTSPGERRRIALHYIEPVRFDVESQCLQFALPAGAYATLVLDHLNIANPRRTNV